jgi:hypothetical protein
MRSLAIIAPLCILIAFQCVAEGVYVAFGTSPSDAAGRIFSLSLALFLVFWIIADARRRHCMPCHDFGFLVGLFLPVSLVWYLIWTRGWRGLALLVGFIALVLLPQISAALVWLMLCGTG